MTQRGLPFTLELAEPADAEAYVRCHVACLAETYVPAIMPPAFAAQYEADIPQLIESRRASLEEAAAADRAGVEPRRRCWVARVDGVVVGVASSGEGTDWWEYDNTPPPVSFNLEHLYTRRSTHGTGLGQALLDIALPGRRSAYLWIIDGNARARRFYERNGFVEEGYTVLAHDRWFHRPMSRLWRPDANAAHRQPASETTAARA